MPASLSVPAWSVTATLRRLVASLSATSLLKPLAVLLLLRFVYYSYLKPAFWSPLRHIPGPRRSHWFFGNALQLVGSKTLYTLTSWAEQYGPVVSFEIAGKPRIVSTRRREKKYHLPCEKKENGRKDEKRSMKIGRWRGRRRGKRRSTSS
jgi:hypothetical protein